MTFASQYLDVRLALPLVALWHVITFSASMPILFSSVNLSRGTLQIGIALHMAVPGISWELITFISKLAPISIDVGLLPSFLAAYSRTREVT